MQRSLHERGFAEQIGLQKIKILANSVFGKRGVSCVMIEAFLITVLMMGTAVLSWQIADCTHLPLEI